MKNNTKTPDYIFETSWEVADKIGGIHTVLSTKAKSMQGMVKDNLIFIGPDFWRDDTKPNPEFTEDLELFKKWKEHALTENFRFRVGRWNIEGNPIVILVDFTTLIPKKDEILTTLWEDYQLDSISGGWDYVEPVLFGYEAGRIIESFCKYNLIFGNEIIAHFHEWMTGSGILYLKKTAPYVSTVFTTHATVIGRTISGNGRQLYEKLEQYNADFIAREFNVSAKHSLEFTSAQNADIFTTVSDITTTECVQFLKRKPEVVTTNGFEDAFVPKGDAFIEKNKTARQKLKQVAEAMFGYELKKDTVFITTSGRYEYRNKGIDVFLDSLKKIKGTNQDIVAFVMVPADITGPNQQLRQKINGNKDINIIEKALTHELRHRDYDPVINKLKELNFSNNKEDKVKVIFAPTYLNGNDGIFNLKYYDLLIGFDLTVFPSYYEPWGYTPMESIAFKVPTITSDYTGFGLWVEKEIGDINNAVAVIKRSTKNYDQVTEDIANKIVAFFNYSKEEKARIKDSAYAISKKASWLNFITNYEKAYKLALNKKEDREGEIAEINYADIIAGRQESQESDKPKWRRVEIKSLLPEVLTGLNEISNNLWWTWNTEVEQLFRHIEPALWTKSEHNPKTFLEKVTSKRFNEVIKDENFINKYNKIYTKFKKYIEEGKNQVEPKIAYFSMEFGFHDTIRIFSGGLGILAGDYLKESSDSNVNMVGVGLLYRKGYFKQILSPDGQQIAEDNLQDFSKMPLKKVTDENGDWLKISVMFPGRAVSVRLWQVEVGRNKLYLLDTDHNDNSEHDRSITHKLYGGDHENRFKQEMILGIGGIRALKKIGIKPNIYHCNEGHAAFIGLERLNKLISEKLYSFETSLEIVRSSALFTTHTPVPAGHDTFSEDILRTYMSHYPERLNISWDDFMNLGKSSPNDYKFSMSYLAANCSQEINGVSMLHGDVTKSMFSGLWESYFVNESSIGYVTNGVHYETWTAKEWQKLYNKTFDENFLENQSDKKIWNKIKTVPDEKIWKIRTKLRADLINYIKQRIRKSWTRTYEDPKNIVKVLNNLNEKTLTIGFARRFATYKRAHLLFSNVERLSEILNNEKMPVQILFAGKAHPNDGAGQDLIKRVVEMSKRPEFLGKILFLEDYNIALAQKLVQGVDIWLNTPTRPLEASGTSGMKAIMNGALHFSVLDGWWVEGYQKDAGWALDQERIYNEQDFQNKLDAEYLYSLIENEVAPSFYKTNLDNVPTEWVGYIKNSIADIVPMFTTKRMIDDYIERFYSKLFKRHTLITKNDNEKIEELNLWKNKIRQEWDNLRVLSVKLPNTAQNLLNINEDYKSEVIIELKNLKSEDIRIELIIIETQKIHEPKLISKSEFDFIKTANGIAYYELTEKPKKSGVYNYAIRVTPKHELIPYPQDFKLVKWA